MKLTDMACKSAKARDKSYKLSDGGGLYLEVTPRGSKLWRMKYRYLGKEKKLSIGEYPIITLSEARDIALKAKKELAQDIDPSTAKQERRQDKVQENRNTFEVIANEWHALKIAEWSEVNAKTVLTRLQKDVFPVIGQRPIREITHEQLLNLVSNVKERGAHDLAKRIIQMCRHIFQYAVITGRADKNIAADISGIVKFKPKGHFAAIESRDIPQFITDLRSHKTKLNRLTYLAVNLLMLTFVRTGELIKAEWREFDFKERTWTIPASRMKMNRDHIVPLSDQSIAILNEIRTLHNNPYFVFPSRNNPRSHMSNNTILMALDRMGYRGKMTGHGFRALAMSTLMEKLKYRHEVPDIQLAHAKRGDVARAYDRAQFLDERKKMMQEWADYLDEKGEKHA